MRWERVWESNRGMARLMRALLSPLAMVFGVVVRIRGWMYDRGVVSSQRGSVPVISVGNLTVGGTGKTPVAAYLVARLRAMGHVPAIVMRGYGADEPEVHALLNPDVRVYASPDRMAGITRAANDGATIVVLDDAFQHRRAARDLDIVLLSAEQWRGQVRLLPAGPFRESLSALHRASLIVVTHKVASSEQVNALVHFIQARVPGVAVASVHLTPGALHALRKDGIPPSSEGDTVPLSTIKGESVLALAGIGDPESFFAQLQAAGGHVTRHRFPDHYAYSVADVTQLIGQAGGHKYVVSTLKDAVKLRLLWPAKGPILWYVSQAVAVSSGASLIDSALATLLVPPKARKAGMESVIPPRHSPSL